MKLVLKTGEVKDVDTSHIFDNQYNTTDGERVYDTEVKYIINDIRLGDFYCGGGKQGTYEEIAQAIAEKRAQINKCEGCYWFHEHTRVEDECYNKREEIRDGDRKVVVENRKVVYEISCAYMPKYGDKCVNDIDETPSLFREVADCFFVQYPQGVPDMKPLKEFMIANATEYGIVPRWSEDKLSIENTFMRSKAFGSYRFEASHWCDYFELENARHCFKFYIDLENKKFILNDGIGYKVVDKLTEHKCEYDYDTKTHKSYDRPIINYDKFASWLWQIVDDFNSQEETINEN